MRLSWPSPSTAAINSRRSANARVSRPPAARAVVIAIVLTSRARVAPLALGYGPPGSGSVVRAAERRDGGHVLAHHFAALLGGKLRGEGPEQERVRAEPVERRI